MRSIVLLILAGTFLDPLRSHADIMGYKQIKIDFTNPEDAEAQAIWSEATGINLSEGGLGWDGPLSHSRDGWIQTKPVALGLFWRPTSAISVRIAIHPPTRVQTGQITAPAYGDVYVRYSPDLKHWSSWQVLQRSTEAHSIEEKKNPGRYYIGKIRVPYRDQAEYHRLVREYSKLDVPWKSDEEAAVQWILARDPDFFSKQIPFIGYVELFFENQFQGGQRIRSFQADISYGMGGMHLPPRDQEAYENRNIPWRFKADEESATVNASGED